MKADLSRKEPRRRLIGGRDAPLRRALDAAASRRQIAPALRWARVRVDDPPPQRDRPLRSERARRRRKRRFRREKKSLEVIVVSSAPRLRGDARAW